MWPVLFSLGPVSIATSWVVLIAGFFFSGFVFWKRGKEEHYSEIQLFDGFILSFLAGALGARLGFVALHFSQFGWSVFNWFNLADNPGTLDLMFLVASTYFLYRFALRRKWDAFEVLDFWSLALTGWLLFSSLADFMAGTGRGKFTQLFIGVVFPGSIENTHPAQLYLAIFYLLLYFYLNWAESRYRIFEWYRMGKKSAHTGFLIATFFIIFSFFSALMLIVRLPEFMIGNWSLDFWLYLLGMIIGLQLLLRRSDKPLFPTAFSNKVKKQDEEILP